MDEALSLKGPRVYGDAPRLLAKRTIDGITGHFSLGGKNMGDVRDARWTRTKDALTSPCIIACYQECTVETMTHLYASNRKSSNPERLYLNSTLSTAAFTFGFINKSSLTEIRLTLER